MTPAEVVIHELGVRPLARKLGVTPGCISKWKSRGGAVPDDYKIRIIEIARQEGRVITSDDLVYGRPDKLCNRYHPPETKCGDPECWQI